MASPTENGKQTVKPSPWNISITEPDYSCLLFDLHKQTRVWKYCWSTTVPAERQLAFHPGSWSHFQSLQSAEFPECFLQLLKSIPLVGCEKTLPPGAASGCLSGRRSKTAECQTPQTQIYSNVESEYTQTPLTHDTQGLVIIPSLCGGALWFWSSALKGDSFCCRSFSFSTKENGDSSSDVGVS